MNRKILLAISLLTFFTLSSIGTTTTFANSGSFSWSWDMCNAFIDHASLSISGNVGSSKITVTWTVPTTSYEYSPFCTKAALGAIEIYGLVTASGSVGVPFATSLPALASGSQIFSSYKQVCVGVHCFNEFYPLKYGNYITISLTPCYNINQDCHGTTDTLKVTS